MKWILLLCFSAIAIMAQVPDTSWSDVPGATDVLLVQDSTARFRVDSIEFHIKDAFEDSKVVTEFDRSIYSFLDKLHYETRPSVVRKLLLFAPGDSVTLRSLIESERLLRSQKFFADASIEAVKGRNGENILRVTTSDKWTTTIPVSLAKPGEIWVWSIGLLENNLLGFGQSVGVFYAHDEERDSYLLQYGNPHFIFANNNFNLSWAKTTDGYVGTLFLGKPFLSRSRDEWAYTIEGLLQSQNTSRYWSGDVLPGRVFLPGDSPLFELNSIDTAALPEYRPGSNPNAVLTWQGLKEDSLSVRIGRSFGDGIKSLVRMTYDFHRLGWPEKLGRRIYRQDGKYWILDSASAGQWLPQYQDSRIGMLLGVSRIRYEKLRNFHRIKWTEDVDKGWGVTAQVTRNFRSLGAEDNRFFWNASASMAFGGAGSSHHLIVKSYVKSYLAEDSLVPEELYGRLQGEYMFKPSNRFASVLSGSMDTWRRAPLGRQLALGGIDGLNGLPSYLLAGQARYLVGAEQRWFPDFEIGTVVPVFAGFLNAGQVYRRPEDLDPHNFQVVAGFGVRLGMSKSAEGVINQINISWPLHGALGPELSPRVSVLAVVAL